MAYLETAAQRLKKAREVAARNVANNSNGLVAYYPADIAGLDLFTWQGVARHQIRERRRHEAKGMTAGAPFPVSFVQGYRILQAQGRWVENIESGLRFMGFADEVAKHIDHNGWHQDPYDDGDLMRGAVYRLPHGRGFIPGYRCGDIFKNKWRGEPGAVIAPGLIFRPEDYRDDSNEAAYWAAVCADSMAELAAEKERDYQTAANAGSKAADLREEARMMRRDVLANMKELRALRRTLASNASRFPHLCDTLTRNIHATLRDISVKRKQIAALQEKFGKAEGFQEHFPA